MRSHFLPKPSNLRTPCLPNTNHPSKPLADYPEVSPKNSCIEGLFPTTAICWVELWRLDGSSSVKPTDGLIIWCHHREPVKLQEAGPSWRKVTRMISCFQFIPPSSASGLSWAKQFSLAAPFYHILPHLRSKPINHGIKPLTVWHKIYLSSYKLFTSGILS